MSDTDTIMLVTSAGISERTGIDEDVVAHAITSGRLPSIRLSERTLVDLDAMDAWLAGPWWLTASNPPCRSWCATDHKPHEFSVGAALMCMAVVECSLPEIREVAVVAITDADERDGAKPGSLEFHPPAIEITLDEDGDRWSPEALERVMAALPSLLAQARALAATDEYATDEQKVAVGA